MSLPDAVAQTTLALYAALRFRPANPAQYTVLASFSLVHPARAPAPIALATGAKCLPAARLPARGDAVHDSHAEVLARRGAVRWLLEEVARSARRPSAWLEPAPGGRWRLRPGVALHMYVSTLPCGDASTRALAAAPQDARLAALKAAAPPPPPPPAAAARGRENYALLGVLRTKPGRADAPPTRSMSCSDKLARWAALGVQGALAGALLAPVHVAALVVGGVARAAEAQARADCARAFAGRLAGPALDALPAPYALHAPSVAFTRLDFPQGRAPHTDAAAPPPASCNESLVWIADSAERPEVLIHGLRRGVGAKQRAKAHLRPLVSKLALFELYCRTLAALGRAPPRAEATYYDVKQAAAEYQAAKAVLLGAGGPLAGWVVSGRPWESFTRAGALQPGAAADGAGSSAASSSSM